MNGLMRLVVAPEIMLTGALLAGLAAAFGRELHLGRRPRWRWWLSTLLLLPAAAIAGEALRDALALTTKVGTLLTMMIVMKGYDGLVLIEKHWQPSGSRLLAGVLLKSRMPKV